MQVTRNRVLVRALHDLGGHLRMAIPPRGRHLPIRAGSRYITPRAVRTTFWLRTDSRAFIWTNWLPFAQ